MSDGPGERPRSIGLAPGVSLEGAGQDAAKYGTSNPVVQRLLTRWMTTLRGVVGAEAGTIVDVGAGEGFALEHLFEPGRPVTAVEYRHDKAVVASRRLEAVSVVQGDAGTLPFPSASVDLVTSIELLEHLPRVAPAVREMARISRGRLVVSVPWEPWFRLGNLGRGKNLGRWGNDPEHIQTFGPASLDRALSVCFGQVRVVRAFPWLIAEASDPIRGDRTGS